MEIGSLSPIYLHDEDAHDVSNAYYVGLDVGGTKTLCLVADQHGHIVGFGRAGCGSYEYHGVAPARVENEKAVQAALSAAGITVGDLTAAGLGVAGADLPEDYDMLEREIYTPMFGDLPRVFRNDSFAALRGGAASGWGVVVACGTGCTCAGKNAAGDETRVGGLGPEFGDACTGTSIGEEGLRAVWRARDGIIPPTTLTALFVERAGCPDVETLFKKVYHREIAPRSLEPRAPLVFRAAVDGDDAARAILQSGGRYLGAMATAVARRLGMAGEAFEVVLAGSVFKGEGPDLTSAMEAVIRAECPRARLVRPRFEPVVGALLLAYDSGNAWSETLDNRLASELAKVEAQFNVQLKAENSS